VDGLSERISDSESVKLSRMVEVMARGLALKAAVEIDSLLLI
jgi:hypothetical protein